MKDREWFYSVRTRANGDFGLNEPSLSDAEAASLMTELGGALARAISVVTQARRFSQLGLIVMFHVKEIPDDDGACKQTERSWHHDQGIPQDS
jgi:hypothetical protein